MILPKEYVRPESLREAIEALKQPDAVALAGGGLLLAGLDLPYETIVDLQDLPDLQVLEQSDDQIVMGGGVMLQQLIEATFLPTALRTAITRTLPVNIRNHVSLGEAVTVENPPIELLTALVALGARIEDLNGKESLADFLTMLSYPYRGIVKSITIAEDESLMIGSAHVSRTPSDSPIVNVSVCVRMANGRYVVKHIVIGGASQALVTAFETDQELNPQLEQAQLAEFAKRISASLEPKSDYRGSAEYRRKMTGILIPRAIMDALENRVEV